MAKEKRSLSKKPIRIIETRLGGANKRGKIKNISTLMKVIVKVSNLLLLILAIIRFSM